MMPTFPCRCEITSNQYHATGWCFGLGINTTQAGSQVPFALIVQEDGTVKMQRLDGHYGVKLL